MDLFKKHLYDHYVSSGQAGRKEINTPQVFFANNKFFIQSLINKHLKYIPKTARIVDVGCGHGSYIYFLEQNRFTNVYGFDISKEQIDLGKQLGVKNIENKSIQEFLEHDKNDTDIFLMMDILEHLTKQEIFELLTNLFTKLSKNGQIIIHVPNAEGIFGVRIRYGDLTHELAFTPKSIQQLLYTVGFSQIKFYEDKPVVHGFVSIIRRFLWNFLSLYPRLLLMAETGEIHFVLSQNMTIVAKK